MRDHSRDSLGDIAMSNARFVYAAALAVSTASLHAQEWSPLDSIADAQEATTAWDPVRQRVVLFGGIDTTSRGDTWEWDGDDWIARAPVHQPPASFRNGMCYDRARQRVVLVGALAATRAWEWDGTDWSAGATLPGHLAPV